LYIQTENQLKGAKKLTVQMANTVTTLDKRNQELMKEIDRLNEELELLELQIKK
jgi:flagellin-like hook-associated protein FlgL